MGFIRRLIGRERAWTERWAVYPGEIDDKLAMYNVDLGAVEAAPVARFPVRADIDFSYTGDGSSGMPVDAELAGIHRLDEAVHKALKSARGVMIGRVLVGTTGRITGYLPEGVTAEQITLPVRPEFAPVLTLTPDPGWTRVREDLTPNAWQHHVISDIQVTQQLESHGDRLGTERPVEFLAYFPEQDHAEAAAGELREAGFAVTVERDDEADYALQAIRRDPVEPPGLHDVTWLVRGIVERHDGVYDGWGCMVQK